MLAEGAMRHQAERAQKLSRNAREFFPHVLKVRDANFLNDCVADYIEDEGEPAPELLEHYEREKSLLLEIFGNTKSGLRNDRFFHGSGLLKYSREKYQAKIDDKPVKLVPILENVLEDGIEPNFDPWLPLGDVKTISLAAQYEYAKFYAMKYMGENTRLKWQLGDSFDWFNYFWTNTIAREWHKALPHKRKWTNKTSTRHLNGDRSIEYSNRLIGFASGFRRDIDEKTSTLDLVRGQTDIKSNWGIVFVIPHEKITNLYDMPIGDSHEARATDAISPSDIMAIGVPLERMHAAQSMVTTNGLPTEIFSLEAADIHLWKNFTVSELVRPVK